MKLLNIHALKLKKKFETLNHLKHSNLKKGKISSVELFKALKLNKNEIYSVKTVKHFSFVVFQFNAYQMNKTKFKAPKFESDRFSKTFKIRKKNYFKRSVI